MFGLSPRVFTALTNTNVGVLYVLDAASGIVITNAGIDSDIPDIYEKFSVEYLQGNEGCSDAWYVNWTGGEIASGTEMYNVPVYIEYIDRYGTRGNWKGSFVVCARGRVVQKPYIQYVENLASKVDTSANVTIYGHNFNDNLVIFLNRPDGRCASIGGDSLVRSYDANGYDTISFVFGKPLVAVDSSCSEICGMYAINLGYGDCTANSIEAGSYDSSEAWNNNIYLIRYRYDSTNQDIKEQNPGGIMATVDPSCFYSTDIEMVSDPDQSGNGSGKDIYFRIKPGTDCSKLAYYRVKLKYSSNLPKKYGEMTLDGIELESGDLVWLDKQFDGGDGLWVVQSGYWIGLKSYLEGVNGNISLDPCQASGQEPLPVDGNVIVDLGAHVKDHVTVTCDSDFPEQDMYGPQTVCGHIVNPGDSVLLTNQIDGKTNGIWEVTCAEWIQRSNAIPAHSGTTVSGDDYVIVQNDIDFCTCEHGGKNIFHIWYYYLNGSCYLACASRTVKITCGLKGSLFPSSNADISDYRITAESNGELVTDSHRTAGDPVKETCTVEVENYDAGHRIDTLDERSNCTSESLVAPNGMPVCRCDNVYHVDMGKDYSSRDRNGFSIVFWQYGEDEKWHLYAYIGSGRYDVGMRYYVYHICTNGIATETDVDENTEVVSVNGSESYGMETRDSWFVVHGGHLATGFGLFDDTWNFKITPEDPDDDVVYSHVLNAKTLYSMWSIKCTTTICAVRVYGDSSILRTTCADMKNAETTSSVMAEVAPTPDTWGFKFYDEAIGKARLCSIWNSMPH